MTTLNLDANTLEVVAGWERRGLKMVPASKEHDVGARVVGLAEAFTSGDNDKIIKGINDLGFIIRFESWFHYYGNPTPEAQNQLQDAQKILVESVELAFRLGVTGRFHAFTAHSLGFRSVPVGSGLTLQAKAA